MRADHDGPGETHEAATEPESKACTDWRYHAVGSRDSRFDGQFVFAVRTTGVYCRPSCPSRTPARRNIEYFPTAAAALRSGYRACKRCLPDAVPGSPQTAAGIANRAMALIQDGTVDREGVAGLAARLGYSTRQLSRILVRELGAGPLDLARAQRAQTACRLLVGTDLTVADIAHAAGFGSVRQLGDTFRSGFDLTPGELRRRRRPTGGTAGTGESPEAASSARIIVPIELPLRNPYDAAALVDFLAARAVAGVESAGEAGDGTLRYARTLALPRGPGAFEAVFSPASRERPGLSAVHGARVARGDGSGPAWQVRATVELADLADLAPAVARIRRLLDLDADPVAIARVVPHPGIRLPGAVDGVEIAVRAIVGQQISVKAASTHLARLADRLGGRYAGTIPGLTRLFPTASQLIDGLPDYLPGRPADPNRPLRLRARGVATVKRVASAVSSGSLRLDVGVDPEELRARLTALSGIGPWTAAYIAMRLLGDPDVWLPGDLYLKGLDPDAARARYSPWRSYAVMYTWRSHERPSNARMEP